MPAYFILAQGSDYSVGSLSPSLLAVFLTKEFFTKKIKNVDIVFQINKYRFFPTHQVLKYIAADTFILL